MTRGKLKRGRDGDEGGDATRCRVDEQLVAARAPFAASETYANILIDFLEPRELKSFMLTCTVAARSVNTLLGRRSAGGEPEFPRWFLPQFMDNLQHMYGHGDARMYRSMYGAPYLRDVTRSSVWVVATRNHRRCSGCGILDLKTCCRLDDRNLRPSRCTVGTPACAIKNHLCAQCAEHDADDDYSRCKTCYCLIDLRHEDCYMDGWHFYCIECYEKLPLCRECERGRTGKNGRCTSLRCTRHIF